MTKSKSLLMLSLFTTSACAGRTAAWDVKAGETAARAASQEDVAVLEKQGEEAWAGRLDEAKAAAAARLFAEAAEKAPNADRLARAARAYYFLAEYHHAIAGKKDDMKEAYLRGVDLGERGVMAASPAFAEKMRAGAKVEDAVQLLDKSAIPSLYWYATSLGKWARAEGLTKLLFYKDKVKAYVGRVKELDANFFYGAPARYFGAFYAVAPSSAGGDLGKAEASYQESLSLAPDYLATKVLMAENLAVKKQDRALFEKLLKEVLGADAAKLADIVPEQTLEQKKAAKLLAQADELF